MLGVQGAGGSSGSLDEPPREPIDGPTSGAVDELGGGPLDTTVEVETPEHVRFRYQIAGPARRAAAYLVDFLVRGLVVLPAARGDPWDRWCRPVPAGRS